MHKNREHGGRTRMTLWKWTPKVSHIQTHSDDGITLEMEKQELIQEIKRELFFLALQPDENIEKFITIEDTGYKGEKIE